MAAGTIHLFRKSPTAWRAGAAGLLLAAVIVGIAIMAGGAAARALNGVGAIVWLASAALLALTLPTPQRAQLGWLAAAVGGAILGGIVRPGTLLEAILGFGIAAAITVLVAGDRSGGWALLVPAIYLPVHLAIGIGRAMMRGSGMRTAPPPTDAILPLVMVLAALVAGAMVATLLRNARET